VYKRQFRRLLPREFVEACCGGMVGVYRPDSWVGGFLGVGLISESGGVGFEELLSALVRSRSVRDEIVIAGRSVSWTAVDGLIDVLRSVRGWRVGFSICSLVNVFAGRSEFLGRLSRLGDLMCSYSLGSSSFAVSRFFDDRVLFDSFGLFGLGGGMRCVVGGLFGVDIAGIYLKSEGRVASVLSQLGEVLRSVLRAVDKRHGFLDRIHRDLSGVYCYYLVAPVGLREVLDLVAAERSADEASSLLRDVLSVFRDALSGSQGRRVRVYVTSTWPRTVSEEFHRRDAQFFGSQTVSRLVGGGSIYSNFLLSPSSAIFGKAVSELAGFFSSGLVVPAELGSAGPDEGFDGLLELLKVFDNLVLRFRQS